MVREQTNVQPRVLVIDDERGIRESLRFALQNDYSVVTADSVAEGMSYLDHQEFDTVVLDLRLPDIDGIEGLRRIRRVDSEVAVVILTAYGSLETAQSAIQLGANDYQLKPFDVPDFMAVVEKNVTLTQVARRYKDLAADLQRINDNLAMELQRQARMAYIGQLSAGLMHDFSGPLSGMSVYLDLLREEISPDNLKDEGNRKNVINHLDRAEHSLAIIGDMIASFKNLCNGRHGERKAVDIEAVLKDILMVLKPIGFAHGYRISPRSFTNGEGVVQGDRLQLFRALANIINNAIDAVDPDSGSIEIETSLDDSSVTVKITDDGPGISPDDLDRVYERFFTTKENGTGLGMFIAQSVVQAHGGSIKLDSQLQSGTAVTVRLPRL